MEDGEFGDLSWFEEETAQYIGRESLGCGTNHVEEEERSGEIFSAKEDFRSKDDLGGSWSDHEEFMERTVSFT